MNKMAILIKGMANEVRRKIIHKLGGYDLFDLNMKVNHAIQAHIEHYHLQDLSAYFCIPRDRIQYASPDDIKTKICHGLSEYLDPFVEFRILDRLDDPESNVVTIMGRMRVLILKHGGELNLDISDWPALRKDADAAEVDRGGGEL